MHIAWIDTFTLLDFPGRIAATVYVGGCNMRCRFCHNPELVMPEEVARSRASAIPEYAFFRFLESRKGLIDGVVVCGGEPTLQSDLPEFMNAIKERWFLVKLDTNGSRPDVVKTVLERRLADYVAVDVKHSPAKYDRICGTDAQRKGIDGKKGEVGGHWKNVERTIAEVLSSGADHEFRTTVAKGEHSAGDVSEIARAIRGARRYFLQNFRPGGELDPTYGKAAFTPEELIALSAVAEAEGVRTSVRT